MMSSESQLVKDSESQEHPKCVPFVKWAGGKKQLLKELDKYVPPSFEKYFEPFLGGGALFFHLASERQSRFDAVISDLNSDLISAYQIVKDNVEELILLLKIYQSQYNRDRKEFYYGLRANTHLKNNLDRAARFIGLNRTCYNGLYRVNKKGNFNVPIGDYKNPIICDEKNLRNASAVLKHSNAIILNTSYRNALKDAKEGDFVYMDPPYKPFSDTAYFTGFTRGGFTDKDQENLCKLFKQLDRRGCKVMLSNSNTPLIRKLYAEYAETTNTVSTRRFLNCKADRRKNHTDLIIRNY